MHPSLRSPHHLLVILGCLALAIGSLGLQGAAASGPTPTPVRVVVDAISSPVTAPVGTPGEAVPYVLVEAGGEFFVDVSFYDAEGVPAAFKQDTTLTISTTTSRLNQPTPSTGIAPRGATSVRLATSLPLPANQVRVTVAVAGSKGPKAVAPGTSSPDQAFDVLEDIRLFDSPPGAAFAAGIGGEGDCTTVTVDDPVCGLVLLADGARSPQVLLSIGPCDAAYGRCTSDRGAIVQALADLTDLYTKSAPATILLKCDKSLCGQGALQDTVPHYSLLGNAALEPVPACPAKSTIGAEQEVCVDYVSSTRDNAADSLFHILLDRDARVSVR
jgi:hypothetical protein